MYKNNHASKIILKNTCILFHADALLSIKNKNVKQLVTFYLTPLCVMHYKGYQRNPNTIQSFGIACQ